MLYIINYNSFNGFCNVHVELINRPNVQTLYPKYNFNRTFLSDENFGMVHI